MSEAQLKPARMRAAVLAAPRRIEIADAPVPAPGRGEVLVKVHGCGVCASNLPPFEGRDWFTYPFTPGQMGHEAWGEIAGVGAGVSDFQVGDRVATLSQHAYAEFDVAAANQTVALPGALRDAPFPAEPLGCAMNIFDRSGIHAGQTVAIVGIGFLGALLTRLATRAGARVIAIGRRPFALDVATTMGAELAVPMDDHRRIIERVREATRGAMCDVVIEAVGKQWPLDLASELTRERGRLVIAGYHQDGLRTVNMQQWNWRGIDVINAHERDPAVYLRGMRAAAAAVAAGELDPLPLYTHRYPLERLADALEATAARHDGFFKALVMM